MILILFAILGYGAAGVLGVFTVKEWSNDILKAIDIDLVRNIRTDLAATTVSDEWIKSLKITTTTSFTCNDTCMYMYMCNYTIAIHSLCPYRTCMYNLYLEF